MSTQPAPATPPTEPEPHAPGQHAADAHYYRHILHDLIDMGTGFARLLHQQASAQAAQQTTPATQQDPLPQPAPAPAPAVPIPDTLISLAAAFDRIARAVRRSIALTRSLNAVQPARDPAQHRAATRSRILREVEDVIGRTTPGFDHAASEESGAEALTAELHDRLDAPDLDDDISSRPVADIITEICRDLGLAALPGTTPWKRRTPADLEQHRARAAAPSSTRQPGAGPQCMPTSLHHAPANPVPPGPTAIPRAAGPAHAGSGPPDDPAEPPAEIATIPHHLMHRRGEWHPPPGPKQASEGPHR